MLKIAIIPVKEYSARVPNKNFKKFYQNQNLLCIKIEQCLNSSCFDKIYVSSDSKEAEEIVKNYEHVHFVAREKKLCLDETPWAVVLKGILESIPCNDEDFIAWCPVTSPLFTRYDDLFAQLENKKDLYDSVVTVTPLKHYFLNSDYIPINHQWGPWHNYSQKTKPIYQMNLACITTQKSTMIKNQYLIGDKPFFLETSTVEGIDIDTPEEFEMASVLYERSKKDV